MSRQIAKVAAFVKMDEEDQEDVLFWRSKTAGDRLSEVARLRKNYFTWLNDSFPEKMERTITFRLNNV